MTDTMTTIDNETLLQVADELKLRGYEAEVTQVQKVNGLRTAITVKLPSYEDESAIAPTIYPEMLHGESISELADSASEIVDHAAIPGVNSIVQSLADKDFCLAHATLCVANEGWNSEFLERTPHRHIDGTDLAEYPRIRFDDASVVPTEDFLTSIKSTPDEMLDAAEKNTHEAGYTINGIESVLNQMMGMEMPEMERPSIIVISNSSSFHGASAITDKATLDNALSLLGTEKSYIIPSSVHEILMVPAELGSADELNDMIRAINENEVSQQDRLGEHAYEYDGEKLKITRNQAEEKEKSRGKSR